MKKALFEPVKLIANNAGVEGVVVAEKVKTLPLGHGFNAETLEYTDMSKAGIIDPAKVVRTALQNAASIGSLILTAEAAIAEKKEKETTPPPPAYPEY